MEADASRSSTDDIQVPPKPRAAPAQHPRGAPHPRGAQHPRGAGPPGLADPQPCAAEPAGADDLVKRVASLDGDELQTVLSALKSRRIEVLKEQQAEEEETIPAAPPRKAIPDEPPMVPTAKVMPPGTPKRAPPCKAKPPGLKAEDTVGPWSGMLGGPPPKKEAPPSPSQSREQAPPGPPPKKEGPPGAKHADPRCIYPGKPADKSRPRAERDSDHVDFLNKEVRKLHHLLFQNRWEDANELMRSHPRLAPWPLPQDHPGHDGCALHAVAHRPAPLWLQRRVLDTVVGLHPQVMNVPSGNARTTPLHLAIASKQPRVFVQALIDAKADVNAENRNHKTPLDLASLSSSKELERLLENSGGQRNGPRIQNPGMGKRRFEEKRKRRDDDQEDENEQSSRKRSWD